MTIARSCFSPHASPPAENSVTLEWGRPVPAVRVRVIRWTCACAPPIFELCAAGGRYFVRRTCAGTVHETERLLSRDAERLWSALLRGDVR